VAADRAVHSRLQFSKGDIIGPTIRAQVCLMAASVVAAEDQDMASTESAHRQ
jgi:hypothetical protein